MRNKTQKTIKKNRKESFKDIRKWYRYQFFGNAKVSAYGERKIYNTNIANISLSGIGLYSERSIGKGKRVKIKIIFIDKDGNIRENTTTGKIDWQEKFKNIYLIGIFFDEELNVNNQPELMKHLTWLINTYKWPQPYKDQRIAIL